MHALLKTVSGLLSILMLLSPFSPISNNRRNSKTEENRMSIRVATYNIHNGGDVDYDFGVIAKDILDNNIDIIGIQEVDTKTNRNKRQITMKILSELTGYEYYKTTSCIDFDGGTYGTGILSKYPIDSYTSVVLDSDCHEQRMLGHAVISVDGTLIDFYNTHLTWESTETRLKQFDQIGEITSKNKYFIVTGDFNTDEFSEFEVIRNSKLVNNEDTRMVSCGGDGAIDNIVYSKPFKVKSYGMYDEVKHSDHKMVWAELSFVIPEKSE